MNNKHKRPILIAAAMLGAALLCGFTYSRKEGGEIPGGEQMRTLHYNGHRYICYRFYNKKYTSYAGWGYGGASIVHDPDCPCGKGYQ